MSARHRQRYADSRCYTRGATIRKTVPYKPKKLHVFGICYISLDEVLLACGVEGLRAISIQSEQMSSRRPAASTQSGELLVRRVAFDRYTKTLLLLVEAPAATTGKPV